MSEPDREMDELDRLLETHLAPPPAPDPQWVRELGTASPALFEALMLRQRTLETLLQNEATREAGSSVLDPPPPAPSLARCPFCHADVRPDASDWVVCKACLARHHEACWRESPRCGSCGSGGYLPAERRVAAPIVLPRWARWAAAGAAALVLAIYGVSQLTTTGWNASTEALIEKASDYSKPLDEREKLAARALARDPENPRAKLVSGALVRERNVLLDAERDVTAERDRVARERKAAEDLAKKTEADRAEAARASAEDWAKVAAPAVARAEAPFVDFVEAATLLAKVLGDAPETRASAAAEALRARAERRKVDVELALVRRALDSLNGTLAEYWFHDVETLARARGKGQELAALRKTMDSLASGREYLERARALVREDQLVAARNALAEGRRAGVAEVLLSSDVADVESRCRAQAAQRIAMAQDLLGRGDLRGAAAAAKQARELDAWMAGALQLQVTIDGQIFAKARRDVAAVWKDSADERRHALRILDAAAMAITDEQLADRLNRERGARSRFLERGAERDGLVFVPEVERRGLSNAVLLQRDLVTNKEFMVFITEGGYENTSFWDDRALAKADAFRDGCEEKCSHFAPRTWKNGEYPEGEADVPVRGISVYEARAYARWLSAKTRRHYRLPTAREWEIAAGWDPETETMRQFPWGDVFDESEVTCGKAGPGPRGSGTKKRSLLGLADAAGAVRQWVETPKETAFSRDSGRGEPGFKGSWAGDDAKHARMFAAVERTEHERPGGNDVEAIRKAGFRLACDTD